MVVIGAGFSGLAAARTLTQSGVTRIAVLEARDRVGGRVVNQRVAAGFPVPAGAAWVGPGQWAVIDLAQELGVALTPQFNGSEDFIVAGGAMPKVPAAASPIANEAFVRNIDALAQTVPPTRPGRRPTRPNGTPCPMPTIWQRPACPRTTWPRCP